MNLISTQSFDGVEELSNLLLGRASQASKVFVLCDSNTLRHCWPLIGQNEHSQDWEILEVDPGEGSKSIEVAAQLWKAMIELNGDRKSLLINLGGGVITDLGGFIASTFKRGIQAIHVPTSLLGMIDAAIGGKTGINLDHHKNQVGTFDMNIETLVCPEFLETLPQTELLSGFAEMIKHGYVSGQKHLTQIASVSTPTTASLAHFINDSIATKTGIVEMDIKEGGERKKLNFGHTIGHAIEAYSHEINQPLTHGHCVALGIMLESKISHSKGLCTSQQLTEASDLINRHYAAPEFELSAKILWPYALTDKKNEADRVMMVGLASPGELVIDTEIVQEDLEEALK